MTLRVWSAIVRNWLILAVAGCGGVMGGAGAGGGAGVAAVGGAGGRGGGVIDTGAAGSSGEGGGTGGSTAGAGGIAGASACGTTSAGGAAGTQAGTPEICSFEIDASLSPAIPTVGVIDWSTDLAGLGEARIEFTLNDPAPGVRNRGSGGKIDVSGSTHRALMLGLKAGRTYTYRIIATGAGGLICTSPDRTLSTCTAVAPSAGVTRTVMNAAAASRGFIITSAGVRGFGSSLDAPPIAYIIDGDGDIVWWTPAPAECTRALMDWNGANMWLVKAGGSEVSRIGMDGVAVEKFSALVRAHHDVAALPDGTLAFLVRPGNAMGASDLIERAPDGTLTTVVRLDSTVYKPRPTSTQFHANAIRYHLADDTYTVGDRDAGTIVKLTREGQVLWQLGGDCTGAPAPRCASEVMWGATHGHQVLDSGNLLVFANPLYVRELALTGSATTLTTNIVWSFTATGVGDGSEYLGDVQRLPSGNTWVTISTRGTMFEVSPSGEVVQTVTGETFGYANYRETLYGPPLPY